MKIQLWELQDALREHIRARIQRGELTGLALARKAGLRQAHVSNFLNQRRGLSLHSMDQLLEALSLDLLDLVGREDLQHRTFEGIGRRPTTENVPVVSLHDESHLPRIAPGDLRDFVSFRRSFLRRLRMRMLGDRRDWLRFVVVRPDTAALRSLHPRVGAGANLLLDRLYNSMQPYRRSQPNLYAVRSGTRTLIGNVQLTENRLVLRPPNREVDVEVITIVRHKSYSDYILGRVCYVTFEV